MPPPQASNVVAFRALDLPLVLAGSVHSPGVRLRGSRNEVWLAPAYSGASTVMLYVKPALGLRGIVAELLAAQVGLAMGLPCAQPYLVTVQPQLLGRPRGPALLCFGAEQVGAHSMATPVNDLEVMLEMLRKVKHAEGAAVFDEWIANSVRGPGDIVFDPHGAVWLIDHEGAFEPGTAHDTAVTNWLAERLKQALPLDKRAALLKALRAQATKAARVSLAGVPPELQAARGGVALYQQVIQFLQQRLQCLDRLLSQRALPEQIHLDSLPTEPARHDALRPADL